MNLRKRIGAFTNGAHAYHGRYNSRGQRLGSKIHAGIKPIRKRVWAQIEQSIRP